MSTPSPAKLLSIINAQTEIASASLDLSGVMNLVARRVRELTGATGAVVELAEGGDMVYHAAAGMAENQLGLRLEAETSLSGRCVSENRILSCEDTDADPRVNREACRKIGIRSMVVAPLRYRDEAVGALKLGSPQPRAFNQDDVKTLTLMCELIATAMHRAAASENDAVYHLATHDGLTGLPNRVLFLDRLRYELETARRHQEMLGILSIDMDGLKAINDTWGHRAGDAALRACAERLAGSARRTDTVARLGGDEFSVLMPTLAEPAGMQSQMERLRESVRQPLQFEGHDLRIDASIGAAVYPDDGTDVDRLIEIADEAMYAVKRTRPGHRAPVRSE